MIAPAATEMSTEDYSRIITLSLIVIGLIVVAFVVVAQVRRRLNRPDESAALSGGTGFTLSDLRQLHKDGKMTDREFELAKAKILEAAKRASERQASPLREQREARQGVGFEVNPAQDEDGPDGLR